MGTGCNGWLGGERLRHHPVTSLLPPQQVQDEAKEVRQSMPLEEKESREEISSSSLLRCYDTAAAERLRLAEILHLSFSWLCGILMM